MLSTRVHHLPVVVILHNLVQLCRLFGAQILQVLKSLEPLSWGVPNVVVLGLTVGDRRSALA